MLAVAIVTVSVVVVAVAYVGLTLNAPVQDDPGALQQAEIPAAQTTEPPVPTHAPSDTPYSDPATPREATMRHNAFAIDMYNQIAGDPDHKEETIFFSPFSMYMAFSFLYEGARAETAAEMERMFGFYSNVEARHEHVVQTISSINRDDPNATLETANALWPANWFVPYDTYTDVVRDVYLADIETLDFAGDPKGSAERINGWAADKTDDKITEVVEASDLGPLTVAVLNNAIYFKGTWVTQFDPNSTGTDTFWKNDTATAEIDFMQNHDFFNYVESDGVEVLQMPYEGDRLSMLVFLPSERNTIEQLEKTISAEKIDAWRQQLHPAEVIVLMPKFKAETHYPLGTYLSNLGIPRVFDPNSADFSGMADLAMTGNLFVSSAFQDAFVDINEEGTEAAAVTTIMIMTEGERPEPVRFTADHPFIFVIQDDESGTILFIGRFSASDAK